MGEALLLKGGYLPLPGFALWVERMMSQGQGVARDKGQGIGGIGRGDRVGQLAKSLPAYLSGQEVRFCINVDQEEELTSLSSWAW